MRRLSRRKPPWPYPTSDPVGVATTHGYSSNDAAVLARSPTTSRLAVWVVVVAATSLVQVLPTRAASPPSVVFILLDTTRADRFGIAGGREDTTPVLDALAHRGIRFARHFANAHATRPSMPQLMSGRYYHDNILAPFRVDADPREMSFARPDSSAVLLPAVLHDAGYTTTAVSAHTWVSADSAFGRTFDHFELLAFTAQEGHADATAIVDRAIALWAARDQSRPALLYLHFMDMHIPRRLPEGAPRHAVPGYDWRARFRPSGEPLFDRARRRWSRYDASDFMPDDSAHYAATYDTRLHHADAEIGRLVETLQRDDPGLGNTVVVITADHGEELAEAGRMEHSPSMADGVQHVPWLVAGGPVVPGQRCDATTEHVDVVPTVLGVVGIPPPSSAVLDGTSRIDGGTLRSPCGGRAAFYAWEDYRGVRLGHYLLTDRPHDGIEARCGGPQQLYRIDGAERSAVAGGSSGRRWRRLASLLDERLTPRERTYRARHYGRPTSRFFVRNDYWRIDPEADVRCLTINETTTRSALLTAGWFATGRGLALTSSPGNPLRIRFDAPPGHYTVEAATTPVPAAPWFLHLARWRRRAFGLDDATEFRRVGEIDVAGSEAVVDLSPTALVGQHVLGVRLTPPGEAGISVPVDPDREQRLRSLGYVQ